MGVEVVMDKNTGVSVKVVQKQTNPSAVDAFADFMSSGQKIQFNMEFNWFCIKKAEVAIWHSAFLMMFREFGYEFAFSPLGRKMRQLLTTEPRISERFFPFAGMPAGSIDRRMVNEIGIATAKDGFRCIAVLLPSPNPRYEARVVLIPGFEQDAELAYKALMQRTSASRIEFQCDVISGNAKARLGRFASRRYLRCCWDGLSDDDGLIAETCFAVYFLSRSQPDSGIEIAHVAERLDLTVEHVTVLAESLWEAGLVEFGRTADEIRLTDRGTQAVTEASPD